MLPRTRRRFCLVTSAHVANNPRLVKEADALHAAGHDVRVVAVNANAELARRDESVLALRGWRITRVPVRRDVTRDRARWLACAVAQAASRRAFDAGVITDGLLRDQALSRFVLPLYRAAVAGPADVIVAHNLEALPAAWRAARRLGARLAFDFEDLYEGVLPDEPHHEPQRALVRAVERAYVRECDVLLASSEGIAERVADAYGVPMPGVVLNAFPLADRAHITEHHLDRIGSAPSLYWFSQVIGPDRGLEEALAGAARVGRPVQVHFRGNVSDDYRSRLLAEAERLGLGGHVHVHPAIAPDELVARAAEHDIGLAPEQPCSRNHEVCVSNKLFTYLVAGIPVAATATRGQRSVLDAVPGAGFTYAPGDVDGLAAGLRALLATPESLAQAKLAALEAARTRFSWELEQQRLLSYLAPGSSADVDAREEAFA